ncbi:MAG: DUF433 domain-containing protein [Cyanobacteria bacterium NC_groundwater_1444_Ag_S-0.65um_54_12]|nr:DUF433 domain-containing protein [Cyanobacteria bacterium NC_groundwater_1444_Ag_S-0.65um_54_12]
MEDRRDVPNYSLPEAAWSLGLPVGTVRRWFQHGKGLPGVIVPAESDPLRLSFNNMAELYILATIRRQHGVSLENVRRALATIKRLDQVNHPLIAHDLYTDGASLFSKAYGELVNLSASGQIALAKLLDASLKRVERDESGKVIRLHLWVKDPITEPKILAIDPRVNFGRLTLTHGGVPLDVLADFWRAGDKIADLAAAYHVDPSEVETALQWVARGEAAA